MAIVSAARNRRENNEFVPFSNLRFSPFLKVEPLAVEKHRDRPASFQDRTEKSFLHRGSFVQEVENPVESHSGSDRNLDPFLKHPLGCKQVNPDRGRHSSVPFERSLATPKLGILHGLVGKLHTDQGAEAQLTAVTVALQKLIALI